MTVGDVVNQIGVVNTILTFQPAAGVECMITTVNVGGVADNTYFRIYNGASSCEFPGTAVTNISYGNIKMLINNTNYLYIRAIVGLPGGYTGIQTK